MTNDPSYRYTYGTDTLRALIAVGVAWLLFACFGLIIFFLESRSAAEFRRSAEGVAVALAAVASALCMGTLYVKRFYVELGPTRLRVQGLFSGKTIELSTVGSVEVVEGFGNRPLILRDTSGTVLARISSYVEGQSGLVFVLRHRVAEGKA